MNLDSFNPLCGRPSQNASPFPYEEPLSPSHVVEVLAAYLTEDINGEFPLIWRRPWIFFPSKGLWVLWYGAVSKATPFASDVCGICRVRMTPRSSSGFSLKALKVESCEWGANVCDSYKKELKVSRQKTASQALKNWDIDGLTPSKQKR